MSCVVAHSPPPHTHTCVFLDPIFLGHLQHETRRGVLRCSVKGFCSAQNHPVKQGSGYPRIFPDIGMKAFHPMVALLGSCRRDGSWEGGASVLRKHVI